MSATYKEAMEDGLMRLYHIRAGPRKVVEKALHINTSDLPEGICRVGREGVRLEKTRDGGSQNMRQESRANGFPSPREGKRLEPTTLRACGGNGTFLLEVFSVRVESARLGSARVRKLIYVDREEVGRLKGVGSVCFGVRLGLLLFRGMSRNLTQRHRRGGGTRRGPSDDQVQCSDRDGPKSTVDRHDARSDDTMVTRSTLRQVDQAASSVPGHHMTWFDEVALG
ncbi:hypothetical protein GW17_00018166 [Ensete ventricosum]|nr:hypothetical protein GW17_00018166 [Ensete ventricosum]